MTAFQSRSHLRVNFCGDNYPCRGCKIGLPHTPMIRVPHTLARRAAKRIWRMRITPKPEKAA